jgi:hypothetical protein
VLVAVEPPPSVGLPLSVGPPLLVGLPLSVGPPLLVGLPLSVGPPLLVGVPEPLLVAVGVTLWLPVGFGDLDGDAFGDVPRLTPAGAVPAALHGCVPLADELADGGEAVGVIVVLLPPMLDAGPWLAESSTATIAMTPIAAAPIPT